MIRDDARLRQLLGDRELAWLVARVGRRLSSGATGGSVTLQSATPAQREAVDRLFGRRASLGTSVSVRLTDVEALLQRAGICDSLAEAIEALTGPLVDGRARRRAVEEAWAEIFAAGDGGSRPWLEELRATGILRRLSRNDLEVARTLLRQAREIERRLPAGGVPLAELAASITGDSHALDPGTPLGTIAVRLAATSGKVETWDTAEAWREAWTSAGVLCDELSAPVLTVNLRATFGAAAAGRTVYVCENPTVVAAAANRLGANAAPLVCIEGQPKTAARLLLDRLAASGARLAYHGDFDWPGIHIGNLLVRRHGAAPWRFSGADYRAARGGRALHGDSVAAAWDPQLEPAMIEVGRAVHEEEVLDLLLEDLAANS